VFTLATSLVAGMACFEFLNMFARSGVRLPRAVGVAGSFAVCLAFGLGQEQAAGVLSVVVVLVLLSLLVREDTGGFGRRVGLVVLGVIYTGWLPGHFILLRNLDSHWGSGALYIYLALILTWSYDTMAYLVGSFLGRRPVFSRISPAKTLEGCLGGLAGCLVAAQVCRATFARGLGIPQAVVLGVVVALVAQIGDLVESTFKRSADAKDSSHLIPGHGGGLDRVDSLIFTIPALYFFIRLTT
jgi:phosphatidate cytidylyltransferase